ncbi:MAG: tetratricopeptide repeat protein [gamma proteobacterium symbiont of Phacoides pectinatus]
MSKRSKTPPRPRGAVANPPGRAGAGAALEQARQLLQQGRASQAEGLLRQLLARQPGNHQALHMLGLIAHQGGRMEQARDLLEQALQGNRRDPQLWLNYGNILNNLRVFDRAEAAFRKALRLRACIPGGNSGLGMSHSGRGNHREAGAFYRRAAALAPQRLEALRNMAAAALAAGRLGEAEEALVALDGRRSGDPQGALLWVKLHLARGEIEHALAVIEGAGLEALRRNLYRGYVLAQAGRFAEAGACYRAVLAEDPGLGAALTALASICDGDDDPAHLIGELERVLAAGEPEAGERIVLDFSLGSLYDRAGLYDQAFSHYAAGNRRKGLHFDRAAYADRTDRLIETFDRGYFEERSGLGSDS